MTYQPKIEIDIFAPDYPFQDELNEYKEKVQSKYDKLPVNAQNWLNKAGFDGIHIYQPKNSKHHFLSLYDLWDTAFFEYENNERNKRTLGINSDDDLATAYLSFAMFLIISKSYEEIDSPLALQKAFLNFHK